MEKIDDKLYKQLDILDKLKAKHIQQLDIQFDDVSITRIANKKRIWERASHQIVW